MAILVSLDHLTEYRFDRAVGLSPHVVRLRPAPHSRTPIHAYALKVTPEEHFINWQQDPFGNYLARIVFPTKTRRLSVQVDLVAEMTVINPFDFFVEEHAKQYPFEYQSQLRGELMPYLEIKESGPALMAWLAEVDRAPEPKPLGNIVDFLVGVNGRLQKDIGYLIRMEPGIQSCEVTLTKASGSCRDSAWLLVQILRHLGLAARFVSGYLVQLTADVKALDGSSGPERDFTDLHAWAEVYIPGAGWLGLDPTSGLFAGEGHIPLACTPDPSSAAPITGSTERCETELYFHNEVSRIHEDPRVTKPYTDQQWAEIEALGYAVDRDLDDWDVRLTMGGEPTFVSVDDMDGAQWNTAALGEDKRRLAGDLVRRLKDRFAPGGVLHFAQGKWYPGEPLPRWALNCYWRRDGEPVWRDLALMADERADQGLGAREAERFVRVLCGYLGLDPDLALPGYEDVFYYLWKEDRLPANVDPLDSRLDDPLERARLARLFGQGLDGVIGYALPLARPMDGGEEGWVSSRWAFRSRHMYLVPGDSPMGLRLPLESLPWNGQEPRQPERCAFEERPPLGDVYGEVARRYGRFSSGSMPRPLAEVGEADRRLSDASRRTIHTALCVEPRNGHLYVFLPPLTHLEHWLDLVASIEHAASDLGMAVILEGYKPPSDHRLLGFSVTPDPGVIEVNVHPAYDWEEIVRTTTVLYEEAHLARLGTEKFMLDGRHSGTGGGNHVTIGGPTPADSPLLRRPDLLRSLVTYWQNHPSLSYLFSGLFVGPTSQAPRVDEARDDSLYELEIAFQQIPDGEVPEPWLVDRLVRNLLVDVSGNTHRTEFCVDKLYSPDTPSGRQGLVELRAFEMPPHARMSLVQMLLLRTLIARFWATPYARKPVRWGTELHDRFLLPFYVWEDFNDVVCEVREAGYPLQLEWFAPFYEFRFPHLGEAQVPGSMRLRLRTAIEPWHVLGEEVTSQGTARYVDSSVERVEVRAQGLTGDRYVVACNGRRVPLRPTDTRGEGVAGVRYKAWQPPSGLHPNIPRHNPLVFEVIDTWNRRSLGGCTYYVDHPGGRHYESFPVNANEAESRRVARFRAQGLTPGVVDPPPEEPAGEHPYTLDLRYRPGC